ncbi:restriction endonuclease subunit S [Escherichia coli]|uniref:restriction endonuclease subunit S n=1 Tax=Escherichia coli TaxID=562 RepID=UPI0016AD6415|nr:restriction endonuclease subunit S [Escherichia coli]EEU9385423.1 restriction endonuclease subunit S [Escherichia coli]EEV9924087.1 restriction endonuclease subunit S [Escherichia coli]EEW1957880.1 restriction endonuclease subunit S [Escherichia coli]EFB6253179.1 restriction endonuclease subunit S [Escherichia coli]EFC6984882.1 restriction endonuclease subunit S [Escherichia coli]
MSEMSYLEKLLDGVEVEWKTLGQTCKIETGKLNANAAVDDGEYMFFTTAKETSKIDKFRWDTEALLIAGNANVGEVKHYIGKFEAYQRTYVLTNFDENVSVRFLYFVLSHSLKKYLEERTNSAAMTYIVLSTLENFPIPIPCPDNPEKSLAIQSEIVRILDTFTALTAELTAELNMRKKQYNYYRDQLLSFKEGEVEWKTLGEIGEFIRGKRFTKADYVEDGGISVIHYGEIYTRYGVYTTHSLSQVRADMAASLRYAKHGDVVITDVGETVEDVGKAVAWLGDDDIAIHDHCYAFRHSLNPKFISYYMQTDSFISEKAKYVARTKVNTLLINGFSKIMIPVPYPKDHEKSLKEQARIVAILDKFDTLTNSITEGLPREIELRQKQYEYYRDLLFSFPKPETVSN